MRYVILITTIVAGLLVPALLTERALAGDPPRVLFIRGADRSGGFLEGGDDASRTEHLGDIFNLAINNGNHGWGQWRLALEADGFVVEQVTETAETVSGPSAGVAVDLTALNLSGYDGIVFGSNNAVYSPASIDAIQSFVNDGGGVLFISDANFGGNWADAADSDQQFLDRFGLLMNQDQGTYALRRIDGEFLQADHPIFAGVDAIDGEGVSPLSAVPATARLAPAKGNTRINAPPFGNNQQGGSRATNNTDASVVALSVGAGRVVGHFDRNTFFNENGAGTDITRLDNARYGVNLIRFLTSRADLLFADGFEPPSIVR